MMQEAIKTYIAELNKLYATGVAREHAYRVPLQNLMTVLSRIEKQMEERDTFQGRLYRK